MNFPSGKLTLIKDLAVDSTVRIVGKLVEYDISKQCLVLEHQKASITVDTRYVGEFKHIIGNYYSVLGQVQDGLILRARLIRNVHGLDISLYEKVLEKRKQFLIDSGILNSDD